MATNACNVEASRWPIPQSSRISCVLIHRTHNIHMYQGLQTLQDRRLDVAPLAAKMLTHAS